MRRIITAMNRFFIIALSLAFLSVGIVGVSMMGSHSDCLFGKFGSCAMDAVAMVSSHFAVFGVLSSAFFPTPIVLISLLVFLLLILSILTDLLNVRLVLYKGYELLSRRTSYLFKEEFCHWLSLHENSPSLSAART